MLLSYLTNASGNLVYSFIIWYN